MFHEDENSSVQRSLQSGSEQLTPDPLSATLLRHIGTLEDELARLRESLREKEALEATVTRLREANEHLVVAAINAQGSRDDAEATNRRQNEFLAMLAHELRNPLVPISMSAPLLERSADASPQLLNFSKVIRRQVDHMARLLDDLLDAARISSGKITLSLEPMPVSNAIDQALETVLPRIRERGQHLYRTLPPEPVGTRGDRVRLTQVFTNLIGNASKYTGDGGNVHVDVTAEAGGGGVAGRGNGTGIAGLRAHLRARIDAGARRNWLLFGERHRAHDFHFGDELEQWRRDGGIEHLDTVFSRDGGPHRYVQDVLAAQAGRLRRWVDHGATVLVCGSLQGMAPAVDAVIAQVLGRECKEQLVRERRYRRDVY